MTDSTLKKGVEVDAEDLCHRLRSVARAYPEDIFTPLSEAERQRLVLEQPGLIDRCSGAMGRHLGQFFLEAADAIEAQALVISDGMRWIPASERLPEPGQLIAFRYGPDSNTYDALHFDPAFGSGFSHWMPLPEAPHG